MAVYYYFASTLPSLFTDNPGTVTFDDFLAEASRFLNKKDKAVIASVRLSVPDEIPPLAGASAVLSGYYRWEKTLRNELVRLRAQKLKRQPDPWFREGEPEWDAQRTASQVFASDNPLEAEVLLEKERWRFICQLETNQFFNLEFLAAYALKLQILDRLGRFKKELGEENFNNLYTEVFHSAEERQDWRNSL